MGKTAGPCFGFFRLFYTRYFMDNGYTIGSISSLLTVEFW